MPSADPFKIQIQPLSKDHSRAAFSCGARRIDSYLIQDGITLQDENSARLYVAVEPGASKVIGYYAVQNHQIEVADIPLEASRTYRRGTLFGAVYVVMLGVDSGYQGRKIGSRLLADALRRSKRLSREIGIWAVVLDALDDDAEAFYRNFGFESLGGGARRLFLPIWKIG